MPWLPLVDWQQLHLVGLESPPTPSHTKSLRPNRKLIGGCTNPLKNISQNWESSPNGVEHIKHLKPPARKHGENTSRNQTQES